MDVDLVTSGSVARMRETIKPCLIANVCHLTVPTQLSVVTTQSQRFVSLTELS